jgi:hypothetical protein
MAETSKLRTRELVIAVGFVVVFAVTMWFVLRTYKEEGDKRSADISDAGDKNPNHIEAFVKILAVDAVKGDVSARVEFVPHGSFAKEDGTLAQSLKLNVNSATGKQEHEFPKDKRMNPVEVVISLYDGQVTDYPFDHHAAFLELYFNPPAPEKKPAEGSSNKAPATPTSPAEAEKAAPTAAASPASNEEGTPAKAEPKKEADTAEPEDNIVPISVDLYGSIPGLKIEAAKAKDSDADYVGIDMKIARSSTVQFFSYFIMFLMWGVTIGVMMLVASILLRGRKIEIGMFSFLAALLFALIAVRNSQPGVPPIGTYSDFISFFWAEVILALCLLTLVFTWLLRPGAK